MESPSVLRSVRPGIAQVSCKPMCFPPGSRILVRVHGRFDLRQHNHLIKSLSKWSGVPEELIFVFDETTMEITVEEPRSGIVVPPSPPG